MRYLRRISREKRRRPSSQDGKKKGSCFSGREEKSKDTARSSTIGLREISFLPCWNLLEHTLWINRLSTESTTLVFLQYITFWPTYLLYIALCVVWCIFNLWKVKCTSRLHYRTRLFCFNVTTAIANKLI